MAPRTLTASLTLLALACREPERSLAFRAAPTQPILASDPPEGGIAAREPTPPADGPTVRFLSEPTALGVPSQHHAVVALGNDKVALVAWYGDRLVSAVRIETADMEIEPLLLAGDIPANHPILEATPGGWLAAATAEAGGLAGRVILRDGRTLLDPVLLSELPSYYPDLSSAAGIGALVFTDYESLQCRVFASAFLGLQEIPCPNLVQPGLRIGTPAVRLTEDELWYAWTERDPYTTSFHVAVAALDGGELLTTLLATMGYGGELSGRVQIAVEPGWRSVVWRGAEQQDEPVRSFLQPLADDGEPLDLPFALGLEPGGFSVERPTIASVSDRALVAWEEAGQLWLQLRGPSGDPLGLPVAASNDLSREARRPSVDLHQRDDGSLFGIVSWESAPFGSDVETYDRFVVVRTFEADP